MPKIRNVSGEDRVLGDGRLVRVDEVVNVAEAQSYTCQAGVWEPVVDHKRKES